MKPVCLRGEAIPEAEVSRLIGDSLMASAGFASVWESHGGRRAVYAIREGGAITAVFPGIEFGRWPIRRFLAMPNGLYGRLFTHPDMHPQEREQLGAAMIEGVFSDGAIKTYVFDFYGEGLPSDGPFEVKEERAVLVDISSPDWEPPDRKLRGEIRRAEREGLSVRRLHWAHDQAAFLGLVRLMHRVHGGEEHYHETFWRDLASLASRDDRVRWYIAAVGTRVVSSHIYFIEEDLLIGWQMYYDRGFSTFKANPYLIWLACCEARACGVRTLDLGATPPDAEGTKFFKERWGGIEHVYRELSKRRGLGVLR